MGVVEPLAHRLAGIPGGRRRPRARQRTTGIIRWRRCHRCMAGVTPRLSQQRCLGRSAVHRLAAGPLMTAELTLAHTQALDMRESCCLCCFVAAAVAAAAVAPPPLLLQ